MSKSKVICGTLENVHRLPVSEFGNPRYRLTIDGVKYSTRKNSMCAYVVSDIYVGSRVRVEIDGRGSVVVFQTEQD